VPRPVRRDYEEHSSPRTALRTPGHTPGHQSLDRIKQIQKNLKATVIIQHDSRDIDKLPAFPAAAR
jgi:phosphoribosyl 1,2-cyclic phosphodiesterase